MHRRLVVACGVAAAVVLSFHGRADAQEQRPAAQPATKQKQPAAPESTKQQPGPDREKLEEDIARELGTQPQAPQAAPVTTAPPASVDRPPTTATAARGASPLARVLLLPDVSAIGSGALSYQRFGLDESPRAGPFGEAKRLNPIFQELELGLQAVVDPYARADIFVSFSDEGAEVEEAFLTALTLPYGFVARGGKFFSTFGRINQQHPHNWDFIDRPLAHARLLGPEALGGAGVVAAWLAPLPWYAEAHLGYQSVAVGLDEEAESRRAGIGRLIQFFDVNPRTTVGLGVSGALLREPGEPGEGWRDLAGADLYVRFRPGAGRSYLALQGEAIWSRLRPRGDAQDETDWGGYAHAVWRQPRLSYGLRYDRAPAVVDGALSGAEHRVSGLVSFIPSEFQRIRLQTGWSRLPGGRDGWEAILGLEFSIGAHGAHPF